MLPLLAATAALQAVNTIGSLAGQKTANQTNIQLAREANQFDLQKWHMSNEYNSPIQQMNRLKQAGLNPNLVYGSGNVSGMSSSSIPKSNVATVDSITKDLNLPNTLGMLSQYTQIKNTEAHTDLVRKNIEVQEQNRINAAMRPALMEIQTNKSMLDYNQAKKLAETQVSSALTNLERLKLENRLKNYQLSISNPLGSQLQRSEIALKDLQRAYLDIDYQQNKNLSKYGLKTSDSPLYKLPAKALNDLIEKFSRFNTQDDYKKGRVQY